MSGRQVHSVKQRQTAARVPAAGEASRQPLGAATAREPPPAAALPLEVRALLDALPMPAVLSGPDGDVLHANAAGHAMHEAAPAERVPLALPGLGECTLIVGLVPGTVDAQTQRLAALGFMVASVCHEVSNPLAAVHSMLQILQSKRGVSPETLEKGLASISANIARVLAITKKLGNFSRVGADSPGPVRVDVAVEEAIALLRHSEHACAVNVEYHGAPDALVRAQLGSLQQVIFNILLNAAQAMRGVGRIEARAAVRDGARVALSIRDSGPGIPPEYLERLFEPFFTTKRSGEGTGLGLAICYEIVHELGGTLRAFNHRAGGACFEIVLPLWKG
ncbi:MAG: ATP-binding protein [Pseudomonadota bacterium]